MKADYIHEQELKHILAALTSPNRLAMELSLATGLRISDVLQLRTEQLSKNKDRRVTVREHKTGKTRRIKIASELYDRLLGQAGKVFVFENRFDYRKHRTRQAVYKDLKRAAALFRVKANVTPHSARKVYAVGALERTGGDLQRVQRLLNHSDPSVTALYAMADQLVKRRSGRATPA